MLRAHPGCAVATADCGAGAVLVLARTGGRLALRLRDGTGSPRSSWQRLAVGSLAHAWLAAGRALAEITTLAASAYYSYEVLDSVLSPPQHLPHRPPAPPAAERPVPWRRSGAPHRPGPAHRPPSPERTAADRTLPATRPVGG